MMNIALSRRWLVEYGALNAGQLRRTVLYDIYEIDVALVELSFLFSDFFSSFFS